MANLIFTIVLTLSQIANSDYVLVTGVRPRYKYTDGKRTDVIEAYVHSCVLPFQKYERLDIKLAVPAITNEEIEAKGTVKMFPKGFQAKIYQTSTGVNISASAESMELAK